MTQSTDTAKPSPESPQSKGIGFGLFLLLCGLALLAEKLGWLPDGSDWVFPAILIAWGASEIYSRSNRR